MNIGYLKYDLISSNMSSVNIRTVSENRDIKISQILDLDQVVYYYVYSEDQNLKFTLKI